KCRLKDKSINDVGSMSLYCIEHKLDNYFVSLINSNFLFDFYRTFINQSVNIQLNDIRQLPIVIPSENQKYDFENLFDRAYKIKVQEFDKKINKSEAELKLNEIQEELDEMVLKLYGFE
ncbi:MAG: hypothetical protein P9L95_10690, partial [Candidatus Tenebribacter mawsonii]|nr:hypothetical protein [Candidatus Tenebribacter mawsonii]